MMRGDINTMKYYAVKKGSKIGVFDNWTDCQASIKGFSKPDFKGFSNREEAEAYLSGEDIYAKLVEKDINDGYVVAFCDGSFDKQRESYSYGVIIIGKDFKEYEVSGVGRNPKYLDTQNVAGEVFGVINAMDWAISNRVEKIKIYFDYEGLGKWLSGEWKANSGIAKMFVSLYESKFKDILEVVMEKVKGHSNNKYNEKADELAKKALFQNNIKKIKGENWVAISWFKKEILDNILDSMKNEYDSLKITSDDKQVSTVYKLLLAGNKITVTLFKSTQSKLLVQGANTVLFQMFITYVNEMLGSGSEVSLLEDVYKIKINPDKIDRVEREICPNFPTEYPESIKRLVRQSIINLSICIDSEDYSQYAFPALRALEGHLKYLFKQAGIQITNGKMFHYFNKKEGSEEFYLSVKCSIDTNLREKIETCYNFFHANRHTLFHFGDVIGESDTTRIIENKKEADEIIKKCLEFICE